ncbi:Maf-like protein, partial [Enterococcus faecalis]
MFTACHPLILASASPRRQEFLRQLGLAFRAEPARIDETPETGEPAAAFARRMAITKAKAIAATSPQACVIGADTVVTLDETLFGKPRDREEALAILKQLQGRTHRVITGFAVCCHDR